VEKMKRKIKRKEVKGTEEKERGDGEGFFPESSGVKSWGDLRWCAVVCGGHPPCAARKIVIAFNSILLDGA
jgi:hypothetical protein